MSLTQEQQAIKLFLSKPAPYTSACGCMGPQPISVSNNNKKPNFELTIKTTQKRQDIIRFAFKNLNISLAEAKKKLSLNNPFEFDYKYECDKFVQELENLGVTYELKENSPLLMPLCPCAMSYVVEVDNVYYKIKENRSESGITHDAIELGKVGGPYKNI